GVPLDPAGAVTAMVEGRVVDLDVLDVSSHGMISLLFLGAGLDAEINRDADSDQKTRLGFFAYVAATIDNLRGRKNHAVRLKIDGQQRNVQAHTVTLLNATRLELLGAPIGPDAQPHDGVADLAVLTAPNF